MGSYSSNGPGAGGEGGKYGKILWKNKKRNKKRQQSGFCLLKMKQKNRNKIK